VCWIVNIQKKKKLDFLSDNLDENKRLYDDFIESVRANNIEESGFPKSSYKVSKALLNSYSRHLEKHVTGHRGIFLTSICPGWVKTRLGGDRAPRTVQQGADTPVWMSLQPLSTFPSGKFWRDRAEITWADS